MEFYVDLASTFYPVLPLQIAVLSVRLYNASILTPTSLLPGLEFLEVKKP